MKQRTKQTAHVVVLAVLAVALGIGLLMILSGCGGGVPGLRFAPGEDQKRSAQTADDLAKGLAHTGAQPGSPAANALAKSTGPARTYAGEPKDPVDVAPLIDAAAGAWETKDDQITAWKLKENLHARSGVITSEAMAELAETIGTKGKVAASEIIHRVGAIVSFNKMTADFTRRITVPEDRKISAEEQARLDVLTDAVDKITAAAGEQAARRPTFDDVEDEALDTIDQIGNVLESYGLLALIPGAGGVFYAARKRKAAKAAQAEVEAARHDEANARHREQMTKIDADAVAARAMELLAQASPPATPGQAAAQPPKSE